MSITQILPFISTAIMLVFVIYVLRRYVATKHKHFLFWGIGLAMFGAGSFAEAYLALAWNKWVFLMWYLFGAALNAAWLGHGTLTLLWRKKGANVITVLLVISSLWATSLMLKVMPDLDTTNFTTAKPISEQYGTKAYTQAELDSGEAVIPADAVTYETEYRGEDVTAVRGILPLGAPVRLTTPLHNIYGLFTLVGGAIWSGYLFWRKRVMPNRVIGNVLIAAGALFIGFASALTRAGNGEYLYLGELVAAILMFWGFVVSSKPSEVAQPESAPAAAD